MGCRAGVDARPAGRWPNAPQSHKTTKEKRNKEKIKEYQTNEIKEEQIKKVGEERGKQDHSNADTMDQQDFF